MGESAVPFVVVGHRLPSLIPNPVPGRTRAQAASH